MSQNKVSYLGIGVLKAKHLSLGLKCGNYLWIGTNGSFLVGKKTLYLAMKYMASETVMPDTSIKIQTVDESGARNAKRSTDFLGDLTYKMLIPDNEKSMR